MLAEKVKEKFKIGAIDCKKNSKEAKFCQKKGIGPLPAYAFVVDGNLEFYSESSKPSARDLYDFAMDSMPTQLIISVCIGECGTQLRTTPSSPSQSMACSMGK